MTSTDLTTTATAGLDLDAQMRFSEVIATGDLLPQAYRGKPANVLLAVGLGQAMGLSPAESLMRIDVIQGKPAASAELIASNVRKAGHKLRVQVDEQAPSATATIVRADDPEFEHTVTRDAAWVKRMGLDSKDNYKKQPATMLQWRAISAVARQACPEALFGVGHTADELADMPRPAHEAGPARVSAADFTAAAAVSEPAPPTQAQTRKMFAALKEVGCADRASGLAYVSDVLDREVGSSKELTRDEVSRILDELAAELEQQAAAADEQGTLDVAEDGEPEP